MNEVLSGCSVRAAIQQWTAVFSECGRYRYALGRPLDSLLRWHRPILWIMLNPSTADAKNNDPTIRRCINFSTAWGYTHLMVGNLYALKATKPKALKAPPGGIDAVGPLTDQHLQKMASQAEAIILAWGQLGPDKKRAEQLLESMGQYKERMHVLGYTLSGIPRHPLMMPNATELQRYAQQHLPEAGK